METVAPTFTVACHQLLGKYSISPGSMVHSSGCSPLGRVGTTISRYCTGVMLMLAGSYLGGFAQWSGGGVLGLRSSHGYSMNRFLPCST